MSELEKKIRKQVACEERAHRLVEQLLENPITEQFLIQAVSENSFDYTAVNK
jgi:phosphoribosylformylglycinamidine (FGAM) synthase PurS component